MLLLIGCRLVTLVFVVALLLQSSLDAQSLFLQVDSSAAISAATGISKQITAQEWLGPLSAIALSPFFGLACLSGAATYGPEWLQNRSSLFDETSPLNNPVLFWLMAGLTIATSLPRFSKVSKPLSLAAEKLEMYSAIIILISMKFMIGTVAASDQVTTETQGFLQSAGISSMPLDILLSIAAALNIAVVNTIKLAIEIIIWLVPFPTIDAMLEGANKSMCAGLMALYAYSPFLATALNLCIFAVCGLVFFRVNRQLYFMRELILRPILERVFGRTASSEKFVGFTKEAWNGLPRRSALSVSRLPGRSDVHLVHRGWFKNLMFTGQLEPSKYCTRLICDQLTIQIDGVDVVLDVRRGLQANVVQVAY